MRPDKDTYFLRHAKIASQMTTCARRAVGCVVVNARHQILGVGFNGVPSGMPHCNEGHACPGATAPSGTKLDECFATHAEKNAVLQCRDPYAIETIYVTTAPCVDCTKYLMNTSARRIVFIDTYPQAEASQRLWQQVGRLWICMPDGARGGWSEEVGRPAFPPELWKSVARSPSSWEPTQPPYHKEGCAILAGTTRAHGCTCGLHPRSQPKKTPDPNCSKCGGKGEVSVGGGCMGYDDEPCTCLK